MRRSVPSFFSRRRLVTILTAGMSAGIAWMVLRGSGTLAPLWDLSAVMTVAAGVVTVWSFMRGLPAKGLPFLANGALAAGVVGGIFQIVRVMERLDQQEAIFPGLSAALLPVLYAAMIAAALHAAGGRSRSVVVGEIAVQPQALMPYCVSAMGLLLAAVGLVVYALNIVRPHLL